MLKQVVRVLIMPEDGIGPVVKLIGSAQRSPLVEMFTFDSPCLVGAVKDAPVRGAATRIMLNPHRSNGTRANDATAATLREAGVDVHWTSPHFAVTHEKSMEVEATIQRATDAAGRGNSGVPECSSGTRGMPMMPGHEHGKAGVAGQNAPGLASGDARSLLPGRSSAPHRPGAAAWTVLP